MSVEGVPVPVAAAVEGDLDELVLRRIAEGVGINIGNIHGRNGKGPLLKALIGYNNAARYAPWIVVIDLNGDFDCAPAGLGSWLPDPAPHIRFNIAVRSIEAWLLADRQCLAQWLGISQSRLPSDPDSLGNPKLELINLARGSRNRRLRNALVPREGSGRRVGPLYNARLSELVRDRDKGWQPERAAQNSDSLARCLRRLRRLAEEIP